MAAWRPASRFLPSTRSTTAGSSTSSSPGAQLRHLHDGGLWAEGPVYLPDSNSLLWSDVRRNRCMRLDVATGEVSLHMQPANFNNGHTRDAEGRVIACEHGTRSVVRFEPDGTRTVLADRFEGKRFNSPNDVVVASDGGVWFTDPTYGIDSYEEGYPSDTEIGACYVYRVDPSSGEVTAVVTDMVRPNGLALSVDERALYVADTGRSHVPDGPRHMRRYDIDVKAGKVTGGGEIFATCPVGAFDGFRLDVDGRIWTSGHLGVHCYDSDGTSPGDGAPPGDLRQRRVRRSRPNDAVHDRDRLAVRARPRRRRRAIGAFPPASCRGDHRRPGRASGAGDVGVPVGEHPGRVGLPDPGVHEVEADGWVEDVHRHPEHAGRRSARHAGRVGVRDRGQPTPQRRVVALRPLLVRRRVPQVPADRRRGLHQLWLK